MRNRSFEPLQIALDILLAIFLVVSLTAASAGAVSSVSSSKETGTKSISTAQLIEPNQYVLHGIGHKNKAVSIIHSTTSITGKPIFNYKDSKGTHSFTGDEIRIQETEIGTMVTVTLESIPDFRVTTLTLLVPAINLDGKAQDFKTIAIRTTNKTTIGGPRLVKGPIKSYEMIDLKGTASNVAF